MTELVFVVEGEPVGKPRMTRRDQWMVRPRVARYRRWADMARLRLVQQRQAGEAFGTPRRVTAVAFFLIPLSWPERRRREMAGLPHQVKPDVDNVGKALLDALFENDQAVYDLSVKKLWDDGNGPRLEVMLEF